MWPVAPTITLPKYGLCKVNSPQLLFGCINSLTFSRIATQFNWTHQGNIYSKVDANWQRFIESKQAVILVHGFI
jgi:hypothetical protein